ncbi:MAG: polysulfide reductase NrfD [Bacteroidetes bacterium]|nr:polysulfide reductase NrfD [Bacteroidota bacterium]MBL6944194.1 polysulfide reductase NrfD [Bacteroidales bacterium]
MNSEQHTGVLKFIIHELKPKGKILTPFNVISGITILAAIVILVIRFTNGLGSVIHASQDAPWGLWINFNVITGVAFAGGAYVVTFMVYILGLEKYRPIVRATVLYALLAYMFYAGALLLDLGRPWKVINPIIGNSFGISSVLFLVAWHFILYMGSLFIEFYPTVTEWIGLKRQRKFFVSLTLGVVIFGIALSTLHQSGLGALFLMAKPKIHPLWYSEFIPILFFISSIFAGLSLVIILETIDQRVFKKSMSFVHKDSHKNIVLSLAKTCAVAIFVYFSMIVLVFLHGKNYAYLNSPWGYWYLVEIIGFVLIPGVLFMYGYRHLNLLLVRIAAVMAILGIILNRLNISTFAFNWYGNTIHFPTWMEIVVSLAVIFSQILVFRWIVRRMPVYTESPTWVKYEKQIKPIKMKTKKRREQWKVLAE